MAAPHSARPDLPGGLDSAVDLFGNRVRVAVLSSLVNDGPATRAELAQRLNLTRSLLQAHLRRLEEMGAVLRDAATTQHRSTRRPYRADPQMITESVDALLVAFEVLYRDDA